MEGGAKGQVGGMEMGEAERKRLADKSKTWRCGGCGGRSNEEILEAQQAEAGASSDERVIPDELKFGYKDEMQGKESADTSTTARSGAQEVEDVSMKLKESQGTSSMESSRNDTLASDTTSTSARSQPSRLPDVAPLSQQQPLQGAAARPMVHPRGTPSQEAVPGWVDTAIVGVLATLIVMIIKKFVF